MRILIAVHGFPPTHCAGAERQAERMAHWLVRQGHEVEVFTIESASAPKFRLETSRQAGLTVHRLLYNVNAGPSPFRSLYDHPLVGIALRTVLSQHQFDLMHLISGYLLGVQAAETAQKAGLPLIVTLTEYWFLCKQLNLLQPTGRLCSGPDSDLKCARCVLEEKRRFRWAALTAPRVMDSFWRIAGELPPVRRAAQLVEHRRRSLQGTLDRADSIICNSRFIISKFAEFGFSVQNYRFIRQGLAKPGDFKKPVSRKADGMLKLGYIGQIKPHKGVDLLISAVLALLSERYKVTLDLWGPETDEAEYADRLKRRTASYPDIRWNRHYGAGEVWSVLAAMDVLVVPSRWYENSPNVILEAHEAGVPVVCAELGGMAELVTSEESGLTFRPDDGGHLRSQLRRLLTDPGLIDHLRANIPQVRSIDDEMADVIDIYHACVSKPIRLNHANKASSSPAGASVSTAQVVTGYGMEA